MTDNPTAPSELPRLGYDGAEGLWFARTHPAGEEGPDGDPLYEECDPIDVVADLESRLAAATEEINDYASLILLQRSRMGKAEQMWRDAHNQPDTYPDLGGLIKWLVGRIETTESERDEARAALEWLRARPCIHANLREGFGVGCSFCRADAALQGIEWHSMMEGVRVPPARTALADEGGSDG